MKSFSFVVILMLGLSSVSCSRHGSKHQKVQPAKVEGKTVTLTPEARKRLGIESKAFLQEKSGTQSIPVSALLYDTKGGTWVFVEEEPLKFHRESIQVLRTQGGQIQVDASFDDAFPIVIQGAAELSGAESGVGK